ncbi:hypothetical protein EGW08_004442 [Elysia chlorotica]|uniref:Uncharacterized protein n=1 Tax=Elysia chlorotica TaxID=188477 RepID=A0A3S0ZVJ1_ELYCH|nr:hypothetical protein EGW08_004442 [Elysia chlorotica]
MRVSLAHASRTETNENSIGVLCLTLPHPFAETLSIRSGSGCSTAQAQFDEKSRDRGTTPGCVQVAGSRGLRDASETSSTMGGLKSSPRTVGQNEPNPNRDGYQKAQMGLHRPHTTKSYGVQLLASTHLGVPLSIAFTDVERQAFPRVDGEVSRCGTSEQQNSITTGTRLMYHLSDIAALPSNRAIVWLVHATRLRMSRKTVLSVFNVRTNCECTFCFSTLFRTSKQDGVPAAFSSHMQRTVGMAHLAHRGATRSREPRSKGSPGPIRCSPQIADFAGGVATSRLSMKLRLYHQ